VLPVLERRLLPLGQDAARGVRADAVDAVEVRRLGLVDVGRGEGGAGEEEQEEGKGLAHRVLQVKPRWGAGAAGSRSGPWTARGACTPRRCGIAARFRPAPTAPACTSP